MAVFIEPVLLAGTVGIDDSHVGSESIEPGRFLVTESAFRDEVFLEGLQFYAYHGANPEERVQGQRFLVDVSIETDLRAAGASDDLKQTISYSSVFKHVREIVEGEPNDLIESVAEAIAERVLTTSSRAYAVTVAVRKPEVSTKGSILAAAGVRIRRTRETA